MWYGHMYLKADEKIPTQRMMMRPFFIHTHVSDGIGSSVWPVAPFHFHLINDERVL